MEGEGVGVVVLKRLDEALADGDPDLGRHPRHRRQQRRQRQGRLHRAQHRRPGATSSPRRTPWPASTADTISYVEAHGTGTSLGDPIEVTALTQVFRAAARTGRRSARSASVKTNIGHLDAAAGVAGLIKTVLSLKHRQMPATLHFRSRTPSSSCEDSPFFVNDRLRDWEVPEGTPRRAGVSSFGIGGTNAHAVVQEAPAPQPSGPARPYHLLILSHMTEAGREQMTQNLVRWLEENPDANMADVAFTLQAGRRFFRQRRTWSAATATMPCRRCGRWIPRGSSRSWTRTS